MKTKEKTVKKYKFQSKILYVNIIALVVITVLLFSCFLAYYMQENNKRFKEISEQWAESAGIMLEQNLFFADNTAIQMGNTPYIIETMGMVSLIEDESNFFEPEFIRRNLIVQYLMPYLLKEDLIYRICIYNWNGDFVRGGASTTLDGVERYLDNSRIDTITTQIESSSKKRIFQIYDTDVLQENRYGAGGYITLIRPIQTNNSNQTSTVLGYIEVQISLLGLEEQLEKIGIKGKVELSYQGEKFLELGEDINEPGKIVSAYELKDGFKVTVINSHREAWRMVYVTILIWGILLVVIILSIIMVQKKIILKVTKPIISLFRTVQQNDLESVEYLQTDDYIDEIQELQNAFNHMIDSLKKSVDEMVAMRTEKMNAQMLALQAQIDPHFIHNTLAIINSLAEEGEQEKVKEVIQRLSAMIRYSSDYQSKEVVMKDEILNIISYLKLVQCRYEEDFAFHINFSEEFKDITIPKFILQPLVENALKHSLKKKDFPWEITITCSCLDKKWNISVEDNGVGIEEEQILNIKRKVADLNESSMDELIHHLQIGGYSLMNTLIRMYIRYQKDVKFDIYKNEKKGTTVVLGGRIDD